MVDVATPDAGARQVRIKVAAAGVCLSDVHFLESILSPGYLEGDHVTLGHEVAGVIDQVAATEILEQALSFERNNSELAGQEISHVDFD